MANEHYDAGGISAIDVIRAKLTAEQFRGFLLGNVIKYALRFNHKGAPGKDSAKMVEYAAWLNDECGETVTASVLDAVRAAHD
jgi:hypothetical protein